MHNTWISLVGGVYLENATSFLPNFAKFYQFGAVTTRARDQMPSVSAPNWCTIITGQGPEESGVPANGWVPDDDNPPKPSAYELPPISGTGKVNCVAPLPALLHYLRFKTCN